MPATTSPIVIEPISTTISTPETTATEIESIPITPSPTSTESTSTKTNYSFDIFYDNELHSLSVDEKVIYTNQTDDYVGRDSICVTN